MLTKQFVLAFRMLRYMHRRMDHIQNKPVSKTCVLTDSARSPIDSQAYLLDQQHAGGVEDGRQAALRVVQRLDEHEQRYHELACVFENMRVRTRTSAAPVVTMLCGAVSLAHQCWVKQ